MNSIYLFGFYDNALIVVTVTDVNCQRAQILQFVINFSRATGFEQQRRRSIDKKVQYHFLLNAASCSVMVLSLYSARASH